MPVYSHRRRRSPLLIALLVFTGLIFVVLSTVGALWATGVVDLAALWKTSVDAGPEVPEGMIMVPASSRAIPAYSKVSRDDMWDTTKGQFTYAILGPEYVYLGLSVQPGRRGQLLLQPGEQSPAEEAGALSGDALTDVNGEPIQSLLGFRQTLLETDLGDLVLLTVKRDDEPVELELTTREYVLSFGSATGRVLDRDKGRGYAFRELDFLPPDTREGVTAGVPPGKRGLTFEAAKLVGVHGLRIKDRVDLIANIPIEQLSIFDSDQQTSFGPGGRLPYAQLAVSAANQQSPGKKSEARVLPKDAVIVTPVMNRPVPKTDTTVFGTDTRTSQVQQITIAIDEDDVPTVSEAIAAGLTIQCVALSGVPETEGANEPPAGMAAVPISGRTIPANFRITHSDLIDRRTREQRFVHLPLEKLDERGVITDSNELLGRVLRTDKPAGEIFLREDLAPPGTPEGLTGALPSDRRSFALAASELTGADQLRRGDQVDIVASIELQLPASVKSFQAIPGRTQIRVIAEDAIVLAPVGAADARSTSAEGKSVRELILGVRPTEVPVLTQALSMNAELRAVFRGSQETREERTKPIAVLHGQPDYSADATGIPDLDPLAGAKLMVTQVGRDRETWVFLPSATDPFGGLLSVEADRSNRESRHSEASARPPRVVARPVARPQQQESGDVP